MFHMHKSGEAQPKGHVFMKEYLLDVLNRFHLHLDVQMALVTYTLRSVTMSGQVKYKRGSLACKMQDSACKKHGQ